MSRDKKQDQGDKTIVQDGTPQGWQSESSEPVEHPTDPNVTVPDSEPSPRVGTKQ